MIGQKPWAGDSGGDPGSDDGSDAPDKATKPDKSDDPGPQPQEETPAPDKPGAPVLDYHFGDSQGWNKTSNPYGVSLLDEKPAPLTYGATLHEKPDKEPASQIQQAIDWLDEHGIIDAGLATLALAGLAPVGAASLLGGIGVATIAMVATYTWTNVAVHFAGGGNSLEGAAGLFKPWSLPIFVGEILGGKSTDTALQHSGVVFKLTDLPLPERPETGLQALKALVEARQWLKNAGEIGITGGPDGPKTYQAPNTGGIRKPGGPVMVLRP